MYSITKRESVEEKYKRAGNEKNVKRAFSYAVKKEIVEQALNGQMSKRYPITQGFPLVPVLTLLVLSSICIQLIQLQCHFH